MGFKISTNKQNAKENDNLEKKVEEILDEKINKINEFIYNRSKFEKLSDAINEKGTNRDNPIIYKINPNENKYNLEIEIFNIPALLRKENGLITIINKIFIIFKYFSDKMKNINKDEYERKFSIFFKSILNCDANKFNELIGFNIQEKELTILKQGLEKIIRYFGIVNTEKYFNIYCSVGAGATAALVGFIATYFKASLLFTAGIGIGIGIAIGLISYFIFKKFNDDERKMLENNKIIIEEFFNKIINFKYNDFKMTNIFVIAIDKNKNQINNICLFPAHKGILNSYYFPTIGGNDNGESNSKYYEILLKGIECYIKHYKDKLKYEKLDNDMINDIKKDIQNLINLDEKSIVEEIENKYRNSIVCKNVNNISQSQNFENNFCGNNHNYNNQININTNEIKDLNTEIITTQNQYEDFCY